MRRFLAALVCLVLLTAAALPARAAESPPRLAAAEIVRVFEDLWDLLSSVFTLGGTMDPNGAEPPQSDLGGDMDPNGLQGDGDRGGTMDPDG